MLWRHELSARQALEAGVVDECRADTDAAVRAAVVLLGELAGAEVAVRRQLIREAASSPTRTRSVPISVPATASCAASGGAGR